MNADTLAASRDEERQLDAIVRRLEHVGLVVAAIRRAARELPGADRLRIESDLHALISPHVPAAEVVTPDRRMGRNDHR